MKYDYIPSEHLLHKSVSFWQSHYWYNILQFSGHVREIFYFGNPDTTFLLIEIRAVGLGMYGAFSLGTTPVQFGDDQEEFFTALRSELRTKNVIFIQIEPLEGEIVSGRKQKEISYRKFLTPYTRTVDLTVGTDAVLAQMHEKGRYHIRLAEKRGVTVQEVPHTEENIDIWMRLLSETTERDGFSANDRLYYATFLRTLGDRGKLYFAYWKNQVIAAGIWAMYEDRALYYYGASSGDKEHRRQMAPYLLQWHALQDAQRMGIPVYDFMGVADPNNPHDSLAGVTMFKERFGGVLQKLPDTLLIPFSRRTRWFFPLRSVRGYIKKIHRIFR